uniref:Uncharacterized protein n=1 Tax=Trichogramma kaykai TaxID=54128 RepID=A0ABD2XB51_9HYME
MEFDLPTIDFIQIEVKKWNPIVHQLAVIKRELIDEYDEPLPNRKSLKTNQGDVKGISHVDDNDIVKCHYKDVKKENVDVKPDVHMKSEKKFEVNTERNFRTLRNRKINLTAQAPLKNVNIKKEKIIEENVQNNSGDIQRASHNDDKEIAELIECHDVKHKLVNVKEEPKVRLETEKIIQVNAKFNLIQEAAQEFLEIKIERNVVNKKVIRNYKEKKDVRQKLQSVKFLICNI